MERDEAEALPSPLQYCPVQKRMQYCTAQNIVVLYSGVL